MTSLPDPRGLSAVILLFSGGWMTLPDDVTIIIADVASTELVVASPTSADTLAHACHRAHGSTMSQFFFKTDYLLISDLGV